MLYSVYQVRWWREAVCGLASCRLLHLSLYWLLVDTEFLSGIVILIFVLSQFM